MDLTFGISRSRQPTVFFRTEKDGRKRQNSTRCKLQECKTTVWKLRFAKITRCSAMQKSGFAGAKQCFIPDEALLLSMQRGCFLSLNEINC